MQNSSSDESLGDVADESSMNSEPESIASAFTGVQSRVCKDIPATVGCSGFSLNGARLFLPHAGNGRALLVR